MELNDGFQARAGMLRFQVSIGARKVEAFLSRSTCDAVHRRVPHAGTLAAFYLQHRPLLHETVLRKVSAGARHPVVLMARDLQAPLAGLVRNAGLDEPSARARGFASP